MTRRGKDGAPPPLAPELLLPDPTLATRPVPNRRTFPIRAFGPGADANLQTRRFDDLDSIADRAAYTGFGEYSENEGVRRLLKEIDLWAECSFREDGAPPEHIDRTWGFYVFVTSYSAASRERLPQAIDNWLRVQEHHLDLSESLPEFRDELRTRFKFEVIEDERELADASNDRIRENFRAFLKNMDLWPTEDDRLKLPPQARYNACLVLDAAAIEMLAGLQFQENRLEEFKVWQHLTITVIDANWDRAEVTGTYLGVGQLAINGLQSFYSDITIDSNTRAMEDMHPLNGYPDGNLFFS